MICSYNTTRKGTVIPIGTLKDGEEAMAWWNETYRDGRLKFYFKRVGVDLWSSVNRVHWRLFCPNKWMDGPSPDESKVKLL